MVNKKILLIVTLVVVLMAGIAGYIVMSGKMQQQALDAQRQDELRKETERLKKEQEQFMEAQKQSMEDANNKINEVKDSSLQKAAEIINGTASNPAVNPTPTGPDKSTTTKHISKPLSINLATVDDKVSTQKGTAVITDLNGKVKVTVSLIPATTAPQPVHIDSGSCQSTTNVVYALKDVINGKSETELAISMADLAKKSPLSIRVNKSAAESGISTVCGAITFK